MTNNKPHSGSVNDYAIQLQFIDGMIRDNLAQMRESNTTHLIYESLPPERRRTALGMIGEILRYPRRPLAHELRQLLAVALKIECPDLADIPRVLIHMREYPL